MEVVSGDGEKCERKDWYYLGILSIKLRMRKKTKQTDRGRDEELLARLNRHPDIKERMQAILRLAESEDGTSAHTADEIETLLIQEVRQLGQQTMSDWAKTQAQRVAKEVKAQHPRSFPSKKKD